jgi:hypothetical protein
VAIDGERGRRGDCGAASVEVPLVPKLCLGTPFSKLRFDRTISETCDFQWSRDVSKQSFDTSRSQAELGNEERALAFSQTLSRPASVLRRERPCSLNRRL